MAAESTAQPNMVLLDAFAPPAMASMVEQNGLKKAHRDVLNMFMPAVLGGAFSALGTINTWHNSETGHV